ncbi:prephenate dehydrogenase [Streptomyces sp. NPDC059578]|uniref:prephenate dehydrogenase n=1 Tax=Streptomyces sp. NPDC059578 TaxID=3346874 RepID=UPI0036781844
MAVVGTGLIGTSVALAASWQGVTVFLSDRNPVAARTAAALGAGVAEPPPGPVDLAVLAMPPSQVGDSLVELQDRKLAHCYTDVASVKSGAERVVLSDAPEPFRFIGGHPMAGREWSGPLAARGDLLRGRTWALTPSPLTSALALERALELVSLCGAVPVVTRSATHDGAVALTSHVPHLVASLMAARLRDSTVGMRRFAGPGVRDVTRIARGDSQLWGDILQSNASSVVGVVRELQADLGRLVTALDALAEDGADRAEGMQVLVDVLDRGIAGVEQISGGPAGTAPVGGGAPGERARAWVAVKERPGELARLLEALGDQVVAETMGIDADGASGLVARFDVAAEAVDPLLRHLRAGGWESGRE